MSKKRGLPSASRATSILFLVAALTLPSSAILTVASTDNQSQSQMHSKAEQAAKNLDELKRITTGEYGQILTVNND